MCGAGAVEHIAIESRECRWAAGTFLQNAIAGDACIDHGTRRVAGYRAETLGEYARLCLAAGADGLFYATNVATSALMSAEECRRWQRPWDLRILKAVEAQIREQRVELGYHRVTAPMSGIVGDIQVPRGSLQVPFNVAGAAINDIVDATAPAVDVRVERLP